MEREREVEGEVLAREREVEAEVMEKVGGSEGEGK